MARLSQDVVKRALAEAGEVRGGTIDPADLERIRAVYTETDLATFALRRAQLLEELAGRADSASARLASELSDFGLDREAASRFLHSDKLSAEAQAEIDGALQASQAEMERGAREAARAARGGPKAGRAPRAGRISI